MDTDINHEMARYPGNEQHERDSVLDERIEGARRRGREVRRRLLFGVRKEVEGDD